MRKARLTLYAVAVLAVSLAWLALLLAPQSRQASIEAGMICVVIDAGHGGGDPGKVGRISYEDDINLAIARILEEKLQMRGMRVVMTRYDEAGLLADPGDKWNKKVDMQMRRDIIDASNADIFVSIHQNSHSNSRNRGSQVFYNGENEENRIFAQIVQRNTAAIAVVPNKRISVDTRDLMVLRGNPMPSVLIECGFMSNPAEEELLNTPEYQELMAQAIFESICEYYGISP